MDEFLYCLYPEELKVHIPEIERLMIAGMRVNSDYVYTNSGIIGGSFRE